MKDRRLATTEEITTILPVIEDLGLPVPKIVYRFIDYEFDKTYDVYLLDDTYIVKKLDRDARDLVKYNMYFRDKNFAVPRILADVRLGEDTYVLMPYIQSVDSRDCTPMQARKVAMELAKIHSYYLVSNGHSQSADMYYNKYVKPDYESSKVYAPESEPLFKALTQRFFDAPKTLVHDDLLPINVLFEREKVWLIDWATAGMYPYFLDLARFCYVFCAESYDHISKAASHAFLETYYEEMSKNHLFNITQDQFRLDVVYSAFIQYSMFLASAKDINKGKLSFDYAYFKRIIGYLFSR